jgi:hypothetical protein
VPIEGEITTAFTAGHRGYRLTPAALRSAGLPLLAQLPVACFAFD